MNKKITYNYIYLFLAVVILNGCAENVLPSRTIDELPSIFPDYTFVTLPENISPLNFAYEGDYEDMLVTVEEENGEEWKFKGKIANFPLKIWRRLLSENAKLTLTVTVKKDDEWIRFSPFDWFITSDLIDNVLCYRRIDPGYEYYAKMGIYERELSSFKEKTIYENTNVPGSCVNCHSFPKGDPNRMHLHLRGNQSGTFLLNNGKTAIYDMSNSQTLGCVYPYWHPSGKYIIYSVNDIKQTFHNVPDKILDVYDVASDVVIFDVEKEELSIFPILKDPSFLETYPVFSSDGRKIYFCRGKRVPEKDFDKVLYSLCYVDFFPETCTVGDKIITLYENDNASVSFPRPSYDGKYIIFTLSEYGNFSIWHKEADLYLLNLETTQVRCIDEVNSNDTESYHSWGTESRWIVFSSRRIDGLHTRPYLAHIDDYGRFSKPILLPQKDPFYYERLLQSYNIPEFIKGETDIPVKKIIDKKRNKIKIISK